MTRHRLRQDLKNALIKSNLSPDDLELTSPPSPEMGDYTTNIALILSKPTKQNPADLAHQILDNLAEPDYLIRAEVASAGFINFYLKPEYIAKDLGKVLETPDFSKNDSLKSQKIQAIRPSIITPTKGKSPKISL